MNVAFVSLVAALFGACFGSFLNVCIVRLPEGASVVSPPSRCPRCGRGIQWSENIPVASWLMLRGKCAGCALPISSLYPLVELGVAFTWGLAFWWLGPTLDAVRLSVFATVMIGVAVTDLRTYTIPDGFTVFGLVFLVATSVLAAVLDSGRLFAGPIDAMLGACTGAGAIAIAMWLGEWALKREAMGFGDVTLMAVVGAALGPSRSLLTIFLGALLGTIVFVAIVLPLSSRRTEPPMNADSLRATPGSADATSPVHQRAAGELPLVPFGVFLAPTAVCTLVWGDAIVRWYFAFITQ